MGDDGLLPCGVGVRGHKLQKWREERLTSIFWRETEILTRGGSPQSTSYHAARGRESKFHVAGCASPLSPDLSREYHTIASLERGFSLLLRVLGIHILHSTICSEIIRNFIGLRYYEFRIFCSFMHLHWVKQPDKHNNCLHRSQLSLSRTI